MGSDTALTTLLCSHNTALLSQHCLAFTTLLCSHNTALRRGEDAKRLDEEELSKLFTGICSLPDIGQFMRLTLITCFLLQTGCRIQSCVPLLWDSMKLLSEDVGP